MKKTILTILLSIIFPLLIFSQSFKVGQSLLSDSTFVFDSNAFSRGAIRQYNFGQAELYPFDINKDNIPDFNIYLWWYDQYFEYIYNTGINTINGCQVIPINEGIDIESINWNKLPMSPATFFYRYGRTTVYPFTQYFSESGLCLYNHNLYLAFRIITGDDSRIIIGWMKIYATDIRLDIQSYAYVKRELPKIVSEQGAGPFNGNFVLNVTFPKPVQGFDSLDLNVTNGSVNSFSAINSGVYKVEISPILQGTITVDVPAWVAFDSSGNGNLASLIYKTSIDTTRPRIHIYESLYNAATVNGSFDTSISFSETVTGFEASDLIVTNGSIIRFDSIGPGRFNATINPLNEGVLTIGVASNTFKDLAGNWNVASKQFQIAVDLTPPTASISRVDSTPVNDEFYIFLTFSENIRSIPFITVENGYLEFVSYLYPVHKCKITAKDKIVIIKIKPHSFIDIAGNWNVDTTILKVIVDLTHPTMVISNQNKSHVNESFDATFTFSEPVKDFKLENIKVSNGSVSNLDSLSEEVYRAKIIPLNDGVITIFVEGNTFTDLAGNISFMSAKLTVIADFTNPMLIISRTDTTSVIDTFNVSFNFSESVTGFEHDDISVEKGSLVNFDSISPAIYLGTIVPSGYGDSITIYVVANMAQDIAGNKNTASNRLVIDIPKTGIETINGNLLKIYPNPSNGHIVIEIKEQKSFIIEIYNINGEKVFHRQNNNSGEEINISRLAKGIYILTLGGIDFSYTSKLIIN